MAFWNGEKIVAAGTAKNSNLISSFSKDRVDCNSYRLRLGGEHFVTNDLDGASPKTADYLNNQINIPTGQFAFLTTLETVNIPIDAMAFISIRSGWKFDGLINVSGFHVDPGYSGKLVFSVFNAGPTTVRINLKKEIFLIWFADLNSKSEMVYEKDGFQELDPKMLKGMDREIYSLQSMSAQLREIRTDVKDAMAQVELKLAESKPTIDYLNFFVRAIIIGFVVTICSALFVFLQSSLG